MPRELAFLETLTAGLNSSRAALLKTGFQLAGPPGIYAKISKIKLPHPRLPSTTQLSLAYPRTITFSKIAVSIAREEKFCFLIFPQSLLTIHFYWGTGYQLSHTPKEMESCNLINFSHLSLTDDQCVRILKCTFPPSLLDKSPLGFRTNSPTSKLGLDASFSSPPPPTPPKKKIVAGADHSAR